MDIITFTIDGLGQKVEKSIPADVAAAWLQSNGIPDIETAIEAIVAPIVRSGTEAKARAEADAIIESLKS